MLAPAESRKIKTSVPDRETSFLEAVDAVRREAIGNLNEDNARTRGQVFTPAHVAELMAKMVDPAAKSIALLDAGAGTGMLTAACVERFCQGQSKPGAISATVIEIDSKLLPALRRTLELCRAECEKFGIKFSFEIVNGDFISSASKLEKRFNLAILNPPYNKLNARSESSRVLRKQGIIAPNNYAAFLALCADLLEENGELIAITPRSFANGTYFKPFRKYFLERMSFTRFHVFESRKEVFDSDVLQENVVFRAVKNRTKDADVTISTSACGKATIDETRILRADQLIYSGDEELYIHLDYKNDDSKETDISHIYPFETALNELGLKVSTGKVVDFRCLEYLCRKCNESPAENVNEIVPLLYPHNMKAGKIIYQVPHPKKFDSIRRAPETEKQLIANGTYVLVKRFSSKEEKRRITAVLHMAKDAPGEVIGLENHLNYFHAGGQEIEPLLAKGLTIYLNSALLDDYFRRFSGHTQVNATDLRYLKYPTKSQLEALGKKYNGELPSPDKIDELISQLITDERN